MTGSSIGVRESRRIDGEYLLTAEDILNYVKFSDSIACGAYLIDIHNPNGPDTKLIPLQPGQYYTIPYRSLIPKGIDNLLVAGRCISATHEALAACRVMPIVTSIGEGAGAAIVVSFRQNAAVNKANIEEIHLLLDKYGARYK